LRSLTCLAAIGGMLVARPAMAGPYSDVASATDEDDPFDVHTEIDYELDIRRVAIKREFTGLPGLGPDDPIPVVRDLLFSGIRHTLTPRVRLSVFTDLALTFGLPIVISDKRTLEFDQRATPCVFPGGAEPATCVNRDNSTTLDDGLLPDNGYDAQDPALGFTDPADPMIFRGVGRWGLDQLHLGIQWAPMNQAESRIADGSVAGSGMPTQIAKTLIASSSEVRIETRNSQRGNPGWPRRASPKAATHVASKTYVPLL